ncbi:MAG: hypothetical protein BWY21_01674 [Parcubacteria group bacterium ADurb.Bin216]|nr:MAG: hypothetical protein BWY21_01674 [Parcubacteria group bacterium ADurb.Bin216]
MELMDKLQIQYKDFVKRMKGRVYYDDQETKSLLEGYTEELASFISEELDKAREEGEIKGRLEALPITIEEIKNAKMKLLKRIISKYRKMGSSAGDYAMVYIEEELSKLKTKEDESKNKR